MNIVIVGTGYVGLVTGVGLAELGNTVSFIDLDTEKIKKLKNKVLPFFEPDLDKYFSKIENFKRMSFHSNYEELNWDNVEVVFIVYKLQITQKQTLLILNFWSQL